MARSKIIALVGMMGSGKTRIGELVAEKLSAKFIDSDNEIVKVEGCAISDIFAEYGEEYFREKEFEVINDIIDYPLEFMVLSTGGGAYIWPKTHEILKKNAYIIWLDATPEVMYERIKHDNSRPLIGKTENPLARLEYIYSKRKSIYSDCDLRVNANSNNVESIVDEICAIYKLPLQGL